MGNQSIPGPGTTPARGATEAAARAYLRAVKIAAQLEGVCGADDAAEYDQLAPLSQRLMRAGMAAVLATCGATEAQARGIRLTVRVRELEAQAEALTDQLIAAEEQIALAGLDMVAAPYALTDPGPDISGTPWDEL
jgi:hypothetical protein